MLLEYHERSVTTLKILPTVLIISFIVGEKEKIWPPELLAYCAPICTRPVSAYSAGNQPSQY